jgi:sensor domain CHASE-containing protein
MIKFFRKIRQNMIKENRTSKYLLYAIGEIVLVVIGILIALSINNSNQERKEEIILKSNL